MPSIKGTASISSSSAQNKLLRSTKFPPSFSQQVDLSKVNAAVITLWIEKEIEKILGFEDEIVASMAVNLFFPKIKTDDIHAPVTYGSVDPRHAQLDLVGFLGDAEAAKFASELWEMMQDAQDQPKGIPRILIERKKAEIAAQKAAASKEVATAAKSTNPLVAEAARRAEAARKALGRQGQGQQMRHYQDRGRDGRDSRDRDRNREWKPHPRAIAPMGGRDVARPVSPQNSVQHNRDAACKVPSDDHRKCGNSRSRSRSRSRNKHEKQEDVGQSSGEDSYGRRRHRKSKHRRREKDHDNNKDDGGRRSRKHSRRRRRSRSRSRDRTRGSSSRYYRDDRDRRYEDSGNDRKSSSRRSGSNESGSERKSSSRRSGSRRDGNSKRTSKRDYSRSRSRSRSNRHDRSRSQSSCSSKGDSRRSRSS